MKLKSFLWICAFIFLAASRGESQTAAKIPEEIRIEAFPFYNWMVANLNSTTGLPTSHVGDPRFRETCFTYDAAVCSMAFLAYGDLTRSRRIIDFYIDNEAVRRLDGVIEAVLNFSKEGKGIEWQVRTGSNMWLGIASFHLYQATQDLRYLEFAKRQARFALAMQETNPMSATYGGIPLGPKGVSYNPKDQHILWDEKLPEFVDIYSTEGNLDAWALFHMICSVSPEPEFLEGRDRVMEWLKKVGFNAAEHRFNRGYHLKPDPVIAPDTHFWAISALGPQRLDEIENGLADRLIEFMEKTSEVTIYYQQGDDKLIPIKGYDFVDRNHPVVKERGPMVSPEWTLQAVMAYALMAQETQDPKRKETYLSRRAELLSGILLMADRDGDSASLPYASQGGVPIGHEYNTPAEGSRSVIGAAWTLLALLDYDPLNLEKLQQHYAKPLTNY